MGLFQKIFGSNEGQVKQLQVSVDAINAHEDAMKALSDDEIIAQTTKFKERLAGGETVDDILPEAFALVREAAGRSVGERHYDEQLMGGLVLHQGRIAEMKTGEGKTLTSTLPIYLNALSGKGVHVVTVNDYLARRDCNWMGVVYSKLGLTSACITHEGGFLYEPKVLNDNEVDIEAENLTDVGKAAAYNADVTYGTNNEFGFDYLRDNMAQSKEQMVQRAPHYAIVDEVDSILIDEARTPLIISAPDAESTKLYQQFAGVVPQLTIEKDYVVDVKQRTVNLTDEGIEKVEKALGVGNIYEDGKVQYVHHLEQSLKAMALFERDKDYMVKEGQVIIVDEFTGRAMEGRRYSDGLHQAIEAKEGVAVQKESRTLATITFQNFFRMYEKIAGMTGTASTSAEELVKVYNLDVIEVPTHREIVRKDLPDVIYKTERGKMNAIAALIGELHEKGQPVLVGTVAIEKSELLSSLLQKVKVPHSVLNAKFHEKEAEIVSGAGNKGSVTIATNMAGRGTDIKLGEGVTDLGGLYIIGTERHEARRIDNQLRGRSGRQGDPGTTQFYISLEDELMRRFGGDKLKSVMERLGLPEDQPIQNGMISKQIEGAQSKIEGFNFDVRKHILEYDDVINKQREVIYARRRTILQNEDVKTEVLDMLREEVEMIVSSYAVEGQYQWDTTKMIEDLEQIFPLAKDVTNRLQGIVSDTRHDERETIGNMIDFLFGEAKIAYAAQEKKLTPEVMRKVEGLILLRTIDQHWMNHIDTIDHLRQGIGLRGYGQRDPLIEFKKEAFELFSTLVREIRYSGLRAVFRVEQTAQESESNLDKQRKNLELSGSESNPQQFGAAIAAQRDQQSQATQRPVENTNTVGRNDPCTCGSGKKYKKCHGKA